MCEMKQIAANTATDVDNEDTRAPAQPDLLFQYLSYMSRIMPADTIDSKPTKQSANTTDKAKMLLQCYTNDVKCEPGVLWTNSLLARLFFDFFRDEYWVAKIREKIERKLSKLHVRLRRAVKLACNIETKLSKKMHVRLRCS